MKFNKFLMVSIFLLAIITIGAVSASQDADNLTATDDNQIVEQATDDVGEITQASDSDVVSDGQQEEKENIPINISFPDDICYGEDFTVSVKIPMNATGSIGLYLNDDELPYEYSEDLDDQGIRYYGYGYVSLNKFGENTFKVVYTAEEDDIYLDSEKKVSLNLSNTKYLIQLHDVRYGKEMYSIVNSPVRNDEDIEITVNGKKRNVYYDEDVWNHVFNASDLKYGNNLVNVYYPGDEKFGEYSRDVNVTVYSDIEYSNEVYFDENLNINLTLPDDATGKLAVYAGKFDYDEWDYVYTEIGSASISNGSACVSVSGLSVGYYSLKANFTGNYEVEESEFSLSVFPRIIVPKAVVAGDESYITVKSSNNSAANVRAYYYDDDENEIVIGEETIENGQAKISLANLTLGSYGINVCYDGECNIDWDYEVYAVENFDFDVEILEYHDVIIVGSDDLSYVYYYLPVYADGDVILLIDGVEYATKEAKQDEDSIAFNPKDLALGEHNLTVKFVSKYQKNSSDSAKFNITIAVINIPDEIIANYYDDDFNPTGITVGVSDSSTGNIVISVDGKEYKKISYGKNSYFPYFKLDDVARGIHNVTVTVNDDKYGSISKNNTVKLDYVIDYGYDCIYGGESRIWISLPEKVVDGDLITTIDGKEYPWTQNEAMDEIIVYANGLSIGNHTVVAKYTGDELYPAKEINFTVQVVGWIMSNSPNDLIVGDGVNFSLILPEDAKGSLNITALRYDGDECEYILYLEKTVPLVNGIANYTINGLEIGEYNIRVFYTGDDYNVLNEVDEYFTVSEDDGMDFGEEVIFLGENKTISFVSIDDNPSKLHIILYKYTGEYTYDGDEISIEIETHDVPIIDRKANYTFSGLKLGKYHITAFQEYDEGPGYQGGHDFWVSTTRSFPEGIFYNGQTPNISMELPSDADGKLVLTIFSVSESSFVEKLYNVSEYDVNGPINIQLPQLPLGRYSYKINYTGNYGDYIVGNYMFIISEETRTNPNLGVDVDNINVGENASVNISVPPLSRGNVTVTIADKTYSANVTRGKATVTVSDLKAGDYNASVTFDGDKKYQKQTKVVPFTVSKLEPAIDVACDEEIVEGSNLMVNVTVTNATGKVKVNGKEGNLVDGKASIELSDLALGENTITVVYDGDDTYSNASATAKVNVYAKKDAELNATASDISVGEKALINITINKDVTGKLTVNDVEVAIANGTASYSISDLAAGTHNVSVKFAGDKYFNAAETNVTVKVSKLPSEVKVTVGSAFNVGDSFTIAIANNTAAVVTINNKTYAVKDGKVDVDTTALDAGIYTVIASIAENDKYLASSDSKAFTISKRNADLTASASDITVGETAAINIAINKDITSVKLGDKEVNVVNGQAKYEIAGLASGNYTFAVSFDGNKYFNADEKTVAFKVNKVVYPENETPISKGNDTKTPTFSIDLPSDATGNLTVTIGDKTSSEALADGSATVKVTGLRAGEYDATIAYSGDDKYAPIVEKANVTVKQDPRISAKDMTVQYYAGKYYGVVVYGEDGKVVENATVDFYINGKLITTTLTDSKGIAKFKLNQAPMTNATVVTKALGVNVTKYLTIKRVLVLNKVTVKKSAPSLTLTAKILKVNGKYLKGIWITFTFKKTKVRVQTDAKGVAKGVIPNSAFKNLKVGSKVTYFATYGKDTVKQTVTVVK